MRFYLPGAVQPPQTPPLCDDEASDLSAPDTASPGISRRSVLRVSAVGATGVALVTGGAVAGPYLSQRGLLSPDGAIAATGTAIGDVLLYTEVYPVSPLILEPFKDKLNVPQALRPIPASEFSDWEHPPGPGEGQQNSMRNQRHQKWAREVCDYDPLVYKIDVLIRPHAFTTSQVLAIDKSGQPAASFDAQGKTYARVPSETCRCRRSTASTEPFPGPGSTPSTADR